MMHKKRRNTIAGQMFVFVLVLIPTLVLVVQYKVPLFSAVLFLMYVFSKEDKAAPARNGTTHGPYEQAQDIEHAIEFLATKIAECDQRRLEDIQNVYITNQWIGEEVGTGRTDYKERAMVAMKANLEDELSQKQFTEGDFGARAGEPIADMALSSVEAIAQYKRMHDNLVGLQTKYTQQIENPQNLEKKQQAVFDNIVAARFGPEDLITQTEWDGMREQAEQLATVTGASARLEKERGWCILHRM